MAVAPHLLHVLALDSVPEDHPPTPAGGSELGGEVRANLVRGILAQVRAECHAVDPTMMALEAAKAPACRRIPHLHQPVRTGCSQPGALGAERQGADLGAE